MEKTCGALSCGSAWKSPLSEEVKRAKVAVTYSSTAFLECLEHEVPIVSFDWHDFSYKRDLARHEVFSFARSIAELECLVGQAMQGELPAFRGERGFFVPRPRSASYERLWKSL